MAFFEADRWGRWSTREDSLYRRLRFPRRFSRTGLIAAALAAGTAVGVVGPTPRVLQVLDLSDADLVPSVERSSRASAACATTAARGQVALRPATSMRERPRSDSATPSVGEAELALIGALLLAPEQVAAARALVRCEDFESPRYRYERGMSVGKQTWPLLFEAARELLR